MPCLVGRGGAEPVLRFWKVAADARPTPSSLADALSPRGLRGEDASGSGGVHREASNGEVAVLGVRDQVADGEGLLGSNAGRREPRAALSVFELARAMTSFPSVVSGGRRTGDVEERGELHEGTGAFETREMRRLSWPSGRRVSSRRTAKVRRSAKASRRRAARTRTSAWARARSRTSSSASADRMSSETTGGRGRFLQPA